VPTTVCCHPSGVILNHISNALNDQNILDILKHLSELEDNDKLKWTKLRPSMGNGQQGGYATLSTAALPLCLMSLQTQLQETLDTYLGVKSGSKMLLLKCGPGGINWAHQDQSAYPYQALLQISRPTVDFQGGNLYICDPSSSTPVQDDKIHAVHKEVEWRFRRLCGQCRQSFGSPFLPWYDRGPTGKEPPVSPPCHWPPTDLESPFSCTDQQGQKPTKQGFIRGPTTWVAT